MEASSDLDRILPIASRALFCEGNKDWTLAYVNYCKVIEEMRKSSEMRSRQGLAPLKGAEECSWNGLYDNCVSKAGRLRKLILETEMERQNFQLAPKLAQKKSSIDYQFPGPSRPHTPLQHNMTGRMIYKQPRGVQSETNVSATPRSYISPHSPPPSSAALTASSAVGDSSHSSPALKSIRSPGAAKMEDPFASFNASAMKLSDSARAGATSTSFPLSGSPEFTSGSNPFISGKSHPLPRPPPTQHTVSSISIPLTKGNSSAQTFSTTQPSASPPALPKLTPYTPTSYPLSPFDRQAFLKGSKSLSSDTNPYIVSGSSNDAHDFTPPSSSDMRSSTTSPIDPNDTPFVKQTTQKSASPPSSTSRFNNPQNDNPLSDFESAIMSEIISNHEPVYWSDIAGLEEAKNSLKEAVIYPFLRPELFQGLREPVQGMLLFGPPGTGKTMLARAVATEAKATFFSISASSLTSKYLGESEKLVRALFEVAKRQTCSVIFVDEIDSILSARNDSGNEHESSRRLKTEFLIQWSSLSNAAPDKATGSSPRVLVLAATNLPWCIDEAARRRFVKRTYIPLPEPETRHKHLSHLLHNQVHCLGPDDLNELVKLTEGYSGSDITALAKDAAMGPLRNLGEALLTTSAEQIPPIDLNHFKASLKTIRPSVSSEGIYRYEEWNQQFGSQR
ncbi:hypothetical protein SPOG_01332 [Schizosaccharomyces cryophilus OY26]|uniref:AAA+ ATPase domain-containing protein n=1 Tax=Schizosaccharomyces cryophilus (strain OY26 / ATCC MYA-4695 / CBS 11777 / NBRC 106824 / NRRL Y48691) TaxID=653667 RepID=S9VTR0_SCHCR|nr:uncharacterized protein SPOG_01332 [Schizosaccharomyces cryophilus OY26]EPY49445.1 hypothetical protein SPOG_01332 [Schizosaccharomyces cryophilus OY26]